MTDKGWCIECRTHGELFSYISKNSGHEYWFCKKCHDEYLREDLK